MGRPLSSEGAAAFLRQHALETGGWITGGALVAAAEAAGYSKSSAYSLVSLLTAKGHLRRRDRSDGGRGHEYSSAQVAQPVGLPLTTVRRPIPVGAAQQYVGPAAAGAPVGPSLGVVCIPPNRAGGRIEDALAAVLGHHEGLSLGEVLDAVPNGWSRTEVVSGLAEGVITGWIAARTGEELQRYVLLRQPPAIRVDPLVQEFKKYRLRERCEAIEADLTAALREVREYDAPPELVQSLVELRRCAGRTARALGE